jgi:hypothetical protein
MMCAGAHREETQRGNTERKHREETQRGNTERKLSLTSAVLKTFGLLFFLKKKSKPKVLIC